MIRALFIATAWFILSSSNSLSGSESAQWPQFLGPNGRAVQESATPPVELNLDGNVRWKTELPLGHSSPCIWDDSIVLTACRQNPQTLETICIDRTTGEIRWRKACPDVKEIEKVHEISSPAAQTPVTDGERIVVYFGSYGLVAYDFDGNEIWTTPLPPAKVLMDFGSGSSPILVGDKVIVWVPLQNESYLGAYQLSDGSECWKAPRFEHNRTWATPIQWCEGEEQRVGLLCSQRFSAFDADDGQEVWWVDEVATNSGSSPIALGDRLLITSAGIQGDADNIVIPDDFATFLSKHDADGDGKIAIQEIPEDVLFTVRHTTGGAGDLSLRQAFEFMGVKPDHVFEREDWEEKRQQMEAFKAGPMCRTSAAVVRTGGVGDVTQSHRVWEEPRGVGEVSSPLAYQGLVYLVKNGGVLTVRSLEDGELAYTKRVQGAAGGYYASPVAANGRVYLANDAGVVTVIEAGPNLNIVSRCDIGEPVYATPALVGNELYLRTAKHLIAFGPK